MWQIKIRSWLLFWVLVTETRSCNGKAKEIFHYQLAEELVAWSAEPLTLNTRRQEGVSVQAVHGPRKMMLDAGAAALTVARACVPEPSCK